MGVGSVDTVNEAVCEKMRTRARHGLAKYGVSLDRSDLTRREWLVHAQEEAMDLAGYLQKLLVLEEARVDDAKILDKVLELCQRHCHPGVVMSTHSFAKKIIDMITLGREGQKHPQEPLKEKSE